MRGRLWRCTDPSLPEVERAALTHELMSARRAKQVATRQQDAAGRETARARIDPAKHALGERGPVWWAGEAPDLNRRMASNTEYADWFAGLAAQ